MRSHVIAIAAALFWTTSVGADNTRTFTTSWTFTSSNFVTHVNTTYRSMVPANVIMPVGTKWTCEKDVVKSRADGKYVGMFHCIYDGNVDAMVSIGAVCSPTQVDSDQGNALVSTIQFTITCETK